MYRSNLYYPLKHKYLLQKISKYTLLFLVFWSLWMFQMLVAIAHVPVVVYFLK